MSQSPNELDLACAHLILSGLGVCRPLYRVGSCQTNKLESAATVESRYMLATAVVVIYQGSVRVIVNLEGNCASRMVRLDMADVAVASMLARKLRRRAFAEFGVPAVLAVAACAIPAAIYWLCG